MALATYEQIREAVLNISVQNPNEYDDLYTMLGGVTGITASVWTAIKTFTALGWESMQQLVETALVVPPWMAGKLKTFVAELFDEIKDIVSTVENVTAAVAEAGTKIISKQKKVQSKVHSRTMALIRKTRG